MYSMCWHVLIGNVDSLCHAFAATPYHQSTLPVQIKASKVLCIGAGGIGCEVLKTLVMTGFEDIELVNCFPAFLHPSPGSSGVPLLS